MDEVVYCAADHPRRVRAIALVSWPDGSGRPIPSCVGCMTAVVRITLEEGERILVEPVAPIVTGGVGRGP